MRFAIAAGVFLKISMNSSRTISNISIAIDEMCVGVCENSFSWAEAEEERTCSNERLMVCALSHIIWQVFE